MIRSLVSLTTALIFQANCQADNFIIASEIGQDNLRFSSNYTLSGAQESDTALAMSLRFGYRFSSNFVLMGDFSFSDSSGLPLFNLFDATDNYQVSSLGFSAGYTFNISDRFRIVPMVGITDWRLSTREGAFLNPGPEDSSSFDGNDLFGRLNAEFYLSDRLLLNASYSKYDYDFGSSDSLRAGFILEF